MPKRNVKLDAASVAALSPLLTDLRTRLQVPGEFPDEALAEAERAAASEPSGGIDATDVALVTIDPPGARDLDQALHLSRDGDGYLVQYAIADPASFITAGSALDEAVHERGVTFYGPDGRIGLHPDALAEGDASLLPGQVRPSCLWRIRLDATGEIEHADARRAQVRSRAQLTYEQVQRMFDGGQLEAGSDDDRSIAAMLTLLREVGMLRQEREAERDGASLRIPEQEIAEVGDRYELRYRASLDVEDWNAQISLLTGMAAAAIMRRKRIGVFRTLPQADPRDVKRLRQTAHGLGLDWPYDQPYGAMLSTLDASIPAHAAFLNEATMLFRGAGYLTFDGDLPPYSPHGAIGAEYAHVTAPLRRLVDRFGLEIALAATAETDVPQWVRDGLDDLPKTMAAATQKSSNYERECVNLLEAVVLSSRIGEQFQGVIVDVSESKRGHGDRSDDGATSGEAPRGDRGTVLVAEPAVRASVSGAVELGERATLTLVEANPATRAVAFTA